MGRAGEPYTEKRRQYNAAYFARTYPAQREERIRKREEDFQRRLLEFESIRAKRKAAAEPARLAKLQRRVMLANARKHNTRTGTSKGKSDLLRQVAHAFTVFCWKTGKGPCYWCGKSSKLTVDHLLPVSRGGQHLAENMEASCRRCNVQKGAKTPAEYMGWLSQRNITPALDSSMKMLWMKEIGY